MGRAPHPAREPGGAGRRRLLRAAVPLRGGAVHPVRRRRARDGGQARRRVAAPPRACRAGPARSRSTPRSAARSPASSCSRCRSSPSETGRLIARAPHQVVELRRAAARRRRATPCSGSPSALPAGGVRGRRRRARRRHRRSHRRRRRAQRAHRRGRAAARVLLDARGGAAHARAGAVRAARAPAGDPRLHHRDRAHRRRLSARPVAGLSDHRRARLRHLPAHRRCRTRRCSGSCTPSARRSRSSGPIIGTAPPRWSRSSVGPPLVLWVIVAAVFLQLLENYVLVPRIMERVVGVEPARHAARRSPRSARCSASRARCSRSRWRRSCSCCCIAFCWTWRPSRREPPAGRDHLSVVRYEVRELVGDLRRRARGRGGRSRRSSGSRTPSRGSPSISIASSAEREPAREARRARRGDLARDADGGGAALEVPRRRRAVRAVAGAAAAARPFVEMLEPRLGRARRARRSSTPRGSPCSGCSPTSSRTASCASSTTPPSASAPPTTGCAPAPAAPARCTGSCSGACRPRRRSTAPSAAPAPPCLLDEALGLTRNVIDLAAQVLITVALSRLLERQPRVVRAALAVDGPRAAAAARARRLARASSSAVGAHLRSELAQSVLCVLLLAVVFRLARLPTADAPGARGRAAAAGPVLRRPAGGAPAPSWPARRSASRPGRWPPPSRCWSWSRSIASSRAGCSPPAAPAPP